MSLTVLGPWTAGSPNALAFNPLPLITNNTWIILLNATDQGPIDFLPAGLDQTLVAGFAAQKQSLATRLARTTTAAYEIINNNAGSLTVAVMHPFSRGTCFIQSADPFQPPAIDPRWLSNPVDRQVLVEALLFNRQILATPPMLELQPAQFVPPIDADEEAIDQIINNGLRTEFHPSGTAAMLPLEQGGVVNSHLRVYGTQNLRVVDASIFPMIPAAHLQAVVYAVAEKVDFTFCIVFSIAEFMLQAADIIKGDNLPAIPISNSSINSTNSTMNSRILASASLPVSLSSGVSATGVAVNANATIQSRALAGLTMSLLRSPSAPSTSDTAFGSSSTSTPKISGTSPESMTGITGSLSPSDTMTIQAINLTASAVSETTSSGSALQSVIAIEDLVTADSSTDSSSSTAATQPIPSDLSPIATHAYTDSLSSSVAGRPHPVHTVSSPAETGLSQSFIEVLASIGVPLSIVASLEPLTAETVPSATAKPSASTPNNTQEIEDEYNAMVSLLKWLAGFFSQSRT